MWRWVGFDLLRRALKSAKGKVYTMPHAVLPLAKVWSAVLCRTQRLSWCAAVAHAMVQHSMNTGSCYMQWCSQLPPKHTPHLVDSSSSSRG
jgi:hypothetical protein